MGSNQRSQIVMSDDEIATFIDQQRTATLATTGADGAIHLVAMWYGVIDGELWFETKAKSQKAVNLRRTAKCSVLIEDGLTYDTLRGVAIEGTAEIYDDPEHALATGISVWERYNGPYSEEIRPLVDQMMHKRVSVRIRAERTRSWDHRKLGLPAMPVAGSTAPFLTAPDQQ
ncbi:PPOX class F420-dependent oxidoreductase [Gordonia crocea]|uniref:PPOX class F420-dependent enzyme n=1 Tax=Gordonia crocea TaxID=589162 RepID=A0A7I9UZS6_9ACTN|nr:PPOX class F420-dependent oxidoreductase [Gordonia crocea]GED98403.1 PPOX class F420-dependent enzyme [Gordonia crocea]